MKLRTTILLFVAIAASFFLASCTQNYTCVCTIKYSGYPGLPDSSVQDYNIRASQSKAKSQCQGTSATYNNANLYSSNNVTSTETCVLH